MKQVICNKICFVMFQVMQLIPINFLLFPADHLGSSFTVDLGIKATPICRGLLRKRIRSIILEPLSIKTAMSIVGGGKTNTIPEIYGQRACKLKYWISMA